MRVARAKPKKKGERKLAHEHGIAKQYIVNEHNQPIAVVLDLDTFKKVEELLEDVLLAKAMDEVEGEEPMSLEEGMRYYATLKKRK